jgi:uroporphyrinogen-III synthase
MADLSEINSLVTKRILLIRPQRQEDQLLSMLEKTGACVTHTPVMTIEPVVESQQIKSQILELDNFHKAIIVSGNAAELAAEWIDKYWPMLPVGIDYFAVGKQTAALLKQAGIEADCPSGRQNSEALLQLPQLQQLDNQRIIIFRGCGGREILAETLIDRGARVEYCELYKRVIDPQQLALAQQQKTDCLVAHSGELIQAMGEAEGTVFADTAVVVPSERVSAIATELGYRRVISAENALPESMLAAVHRVFDTRQSCD